MVYSSPRLWPKEDCEYLEGVLKKQAKKLTDYPVKENDQKKLKAHKIKVSSMKEVTVTVPDNEDDKTEIVKTKDVSSNIRESLLVRQNWLKLVRNLE